MITPYIIIKNVFYGENMNFNEDMACLKRCFIKIFSIFMKIKILKIISITKGAFRSLQQFLKYLKCKGGGGYAIAEHLLSDDKKCVSIIILCNM